MKFKIGDLALTQNSRAPHWNNGVLVVVVSAMSGFKTPFGLADYQIRRVDGQPFGWTTGFDGKENFFNHGLCWCKESHLKKPEEASLLEESEIQQKNPDQGRVAASECYEIAIRNLSPVELCSISGKVIMDD